MPFLGNVTISDRVHGVGILLVSSSCYRSLSKHLSWSPCLFEQALLVYYQLQQTSPYLAQLLRSQLPRERFTVNLLGAYCSRELHCHHHSHSCIALGNKVKGGGVQNAPPPPSVMKVFLPLSKKLSDAIPTPPPPHTHTHLPHTLKGKFFYHYLKVI